MMAIKTVKYSNVNHTHDAMIRLTAATVWLDKYWYLLTVIAILFRTVGNYDILAR